MIKFKFYEIPYLRPRFSSNEKIIFFLKYNTALQNTHKNTTTNIFRTFIERSKNVRKPLVVKGIVLLIVFLFEGISGLK